MIDKKIKMSNCVGKYATLDHAIMNGAGQCIAKGSKVKIVGYGRALDIKTDTCTHCGQYSYIRNVKKEDLTLCTETQQGLPNVGKISSNIQCSYCGCTYTVYYNEHIVENSTAMYVLQSNGGFLFCPNCGTRVFKGVPIR